MVTGLNRRVLAKIDSYPTPQELKTRIEAYTGEYKTRPEFYTARDRALAATLYLCQLRKSEAHRLTKEQIKLNPLRIVAVKLSKAEKHKRNRRDPTGKMQPIPPTDPEYNKIITRKEAYRKEILIPTKGALGELSTFLVKYLTFLSEKAYLFPFKDNSGYDNQILGRVLGVPPHWLRAYGENELYELFDNDLIAVANYVQVDPRTLAKYIHRTPERYLKKIKIRKMVEATTTKTTTKT